MPEKIKIGILVENSFLAPHNQELIKWINNNNKFEVKYILNLKKEKSSKFRINLLGYLHKKLLNFETYINKRIINLDILYDKFELDPYKLTFIDINLEKVNPKKNRFVIDSSNIKKIKGLNLDLIYRANDCILDGEILNLSKYGILSFHYGENNSLRDRVAGFWEVYNKKVKTDFIIKKLNSSIDADSIIYEGNIRTGINFDRNQKMLLKSSVTSFKNLLNYIYDNKKLPPIIISKKYNQNFLIEPKFFVIIIYFFKTYIPLILRFIEHRILRRKHIWNVAFNNKEFKYNNVRDSTIIKNPKNKFTADPFLFSHNGNNYIFAEEYNLLKSRGSIVVYKIDGKKYQRLGICLKENFHLSFPFLFSYNSEIYMCPETQENKDIRIYKSKNFPLEWDLCKIIKKNISAVDHLIFQKDKLWWLFTNIDLTKQVENFESNLSIFYSKEGPLTDNWIPHSLNPIFSDCMKGRNGGFIKNDNRFYRVNQVPGYNIYGKELIINEIIKLNESEYQESYHSNIEPNFFKNIFATHHQHSLNKYTTIDFCTKKYLWSKNDVNHFIF